MLRPARLKAASVLVLINFIVFNLSVLITRPALALGFSDISNHWAKESIHQLASLKIVNGYDGKFYPNKGVTRAEFAAMIVKALGLADQAEVSRGNSTGYTDTPTGHWASGFIIIAKELGIISGYPDGTFKPAAMIRRDEITSVLVRALKLVPDEGMRDPNDIFSDGGIIPVWALDSVKTAYNYGLISGFPDGSFNPKNNATRGETSVLIKRVLEQLGLDFTFFGTIERVDIAQRLITVNINGQIESFSYDPSVLVNIDGNFKSITNLQIGDGISLILDDSGVVNFIEKSSEDLRYISQPKTLSAASRSVQYAPVEYGPGEQTLDHIAQVQQDKVTGRTSIVVTSEGKALNVEKLIKARGGKVRFVDRAANILLAEISNDIFKHLEKSVLVEEISMDRMVKIEKLSMTEETGSPVSDGNPGKSLNATKEAIKAPAFVSLNHSDGKNQVVAIIDTGIDAGHPDLQVTSGSRRKIVDWQDFTGEGDIDISSTASVVGKTVNLANGTHFLGDIVSKSQKVKYGYLREVDLINDLGKYGLDLNFNSSDSDTFTVILADTEKKGVYDTVFVDTDGDKDFSDENPLRQFSESPDFITFTGADGKDRQSLVLTKIDLEDSTINLGFDGTDHGTHVAGIVAANGKIKGVAPGAQVMALKVLDAAGYGNMSTIVEAMSYAASKGAKIINLSLGLPASDSNGGSIPAKLLNSLTERYGVIFVVAAGNDGPGLSSVATPGDATAALSVGAFNTPEMWKTDYGWDVPNENLWFFSSAGPRKDGAISPSIVAPGSVISTVPKRGGSQYYLSEGTSMAAPHVSGAVALLMEVAQRERLNISPVIIKRAVEAGARNIQGYSAAEQGYGALNIVISWAEILSLKEVSPITVQTPNPDNEMGLGLLFKKGSPKKATIYLKNDSDKAKKLKVESRYWFEPSQTDLNIPPGKTRTFDINFRLPDVKGLFSSIITADDTTTYGKDIEFLATVLNPYELTRENNYKISITDKLNAAQYKRYYFQVPPAAGSFNAAIKVPDGAGRVRGFLFNPKGQLVSETGFAGTNPDGATKEVLASSSYPPAGIWELVVYSSAGLSGYNIKQSNYSLEVASTGSNTDEMQQKNRDLIIGVTPNTMKAGKKNYISVQVRDRYTKRMFEGFVEINGGLYFTRRGQVTLPVQPEGQYFDISVRGVTDLPLFKPWEVLFTQRVK